MGAVDESATGSVYSFPSIAHSASRFRAVEIRNPEVAGSILARPTKYLLIGVF